MRYLVFLVPVFSVACSTFVCNTGTLNMPSEMLSSEHKFTPAMKESLVCNSLRKLIMLFQEREQAEKKKVDMKITKAIQSLSQEKEEGDQPLASTYLMLSRINTINIDGEAS